MKIVSGDRRAPPEDTSLPSGSVSYLVRKKGRPAKSGRLFLTTKCPARASYARSPEPKKVAKVWKQSTKKRFPTALAKLFSKNNFRCIC